jgi:hypothetical protein
VKSKGNEMPKYKKKDFINPDKRKRANTYGMTAILLLLVECTVKSLNYHLVVYNPVEEYP